MSESLADKPGSSIFQGGVPLALGFPHQPALEFPVLAVVKARELQALACLVDGGDYLFNARVHAY